MFLCRPLTAKPGRPGSRPCLVTIRPSSTTAVMSSSATTPVARLAYHSAVEELIPLTFSSIAHLVQRSIESRYEQALNRLSGVWVPAETGSGAPTATDRHDCYPLASPMVSLPDVPSHSAHDTVTVPSSLVTRSVVLHVCRRTTLAPRLTSTKSPET